MSASRTEDPGVLAEALPTFIAEANEQIERVEQLLLELEQAPDDRELLDALFRCAHTVKGSAGVFGLDAVVAFTHHVETLLDRLREGRLRFTSALGTLLLQCNDQVQRLVAAATDGGPAGDDDVRQALVARLRDASGVAADGASADAGAAPAGGGAGAPPAAPQTRHWRLAAAFGAETFRNGMDPLAILLHLARLGRVERVACDAERVPTLDALDPECCHLSVELQLATAAPREAIEEAFSFVRDDVRLELAEIDDPHRDLVSRIEAMPDHPRLGEILVSAGAISRAQLDRTLDAQADAARGGQTQPLGQMLATQGVSPQVVDAALQKQQRLRDTAGTGHGPDERYIRVQADRLDAVIDLLGELVTASAGASMLSRQTRQGSLIEATQRIGQLVEEVRNGTLQLRMVPIGETFARFRRVVRDTAGALGKDVVLEIDGGDTELDKSVVERIGDPLMHLVRNALDHGLETPEQRSAAGKPAQGRLTLSACHESGSILIRVADDGRGIDRQRVLQRAWERGLVENGVVPPEADILKLIFEPGFSTAEQVTNLSGRGVGMDVVRRNIEGLRGRVDVSSAPGAGSRVEIRLPLTLAIIDGFLVGVGDSRFILPLDAVIEVIEGRCNAGAVDGSGRGFVELRGQALPVLDLRVAYGVDGSAGERGSIVVVRNGASRYGVLVDQLLGQYQTVIKPLSRMFRSLRGISGSSILGNGEVALIFDAASLAQLAERRAPSAARADARVHTHAS